MVKKKVASTYLHGKVYEELFNTQIIEELSAPSECAYSKSDKIEDHSTMPVRDVYHKILQGEFLISHPEKTKTSRATVSKCWQRGMKLLLERTEAGLFVSPCENKQDFFGRGQPAVLTSSDKNKLNNAMTTMILSSLRPCELANDPFFHAVLSTAMGIGARLAQLGASSFSLEGCNKPISGDGVRKNLDKVYENTIEY